MLLIVPYIPMLDRYIGACMLSIHNSNDGVNLPDIIIVGGHNERIFVWSNRYLGQYYCTWISVHGYRKVLNRYIDPNNIQRNVSSNICI